MSVTLVDAAPTPALRAQRLGDLARTLPGATAVLRRHRLDFCCGGDVTLEAAAARRGLDVAQVEGELAALDAGAASPVPQDTDALIEHLLTRYHAVHRAELPELIRLARKVERVHAAHPATPHGLADHLQAMLDNLDEHMTKEEVVLFPMMRARPDAVLAPPIGRMRVEHDGHGIELARLFTLTGDLRQPDDACNTWRALMAGLRKFTEDLTEHIHLENNVLFPRYEGAAA